MNNLVYQVDIKGFNHLDNGFGKPYHRHEQLYSDSKKSAIDYASRVKTDYFCLSHNMIEGNYAPVYQKLSFYYLFEKFNYDKIFLLDADAIINYNCPDIFQFDTISAVKNCPIRHTVNNQFTEHNIDDSYRKFFCSGVLLITRDFYDLTKNHWMEELKTWNKKNHVGFHDQSVLNCLAYKYYPHDKINILSNDWGAWWKDSSYINHYGNTRKINYKKLTL